MQQPTQSSSHSTRRYFGMVVTVMLAVAVVDQVVKQLMLGWLEPGVPQPVIGDWFRFYLLFNSGAAFSMGRNLTGLFTAIQLTFVIGALWFGPKMGSRWEALGLALVAGGALGNLCDRLFRDPGFWVGHVVDYISVGGFAVFNLADAAITVGIVIFILATFAAELEGGRNER